MIYIGVDPGVSGGLAALNAAGGICKVSAMPETERDLLDWLAEVTVHNAEPSRAVLESVSASPQMGVTSAFTFGRGYGGLQMALVASRIQFDQVRPQKWQPVMGVYYTGNAHQGSRDKNVSKRRAQQLFPGWPKITHAIADALLLAEYCRRLEVRP